MTPKVKETAGRGGGGRRDPRSDGDLVVAAADGEQAAFAELYRRHLAKARRAARAVVANADDTADAVSDAFANVFRVVRSGRFPEGAGFEAYLVTAARRAAIDQVRRASRTVPGDGLAHAEAPSTDARPSERVVAVESAALVARAFLGLATHLRAVLYLTEIEGLAMRDAAAVLGVTPNACAQRAVRARARLRQRYLQAHVAPGAERRCRDTVDQLGAYVGAGLSPRDAVKVEEHLAGCETCRHRVVELRDIGTVLRRAVPVASFDVTGLVGPPGPAG
ncbi:MAG TPA: sigma-70 family RNA polymerase sigma factor [Acidimicrobiales bacterium]|nr:sigma-70 family RNA polymerase sigma factor [Acidimicrobiales bacterium]